MGRAIRKKEVYYRRTDSLWEFDVFFFVFCLQWMDRESKFRRQYIADLILVANDVSVCSHHTRTLAHTLHIQCNNEPFTVVHTVPCLFVIWNFEEERKLLYALFSFFLFHSITRNCTQPILQCEQVYDQCHLSLITANFKYYFFISVSISVCGWSVSWWNEHFPWVFWISRLTLIFLLESITEKASAIWVRLNMFKSQFSRFIRFVFVSRSTRKTHDRLSVIQWRSAAVRWLDWMIHTGGIYLVVDSAPLSMAFVVVGYSSRFHQAERSFYQASVG